MQTTARSARPPVCKAFKRLVIAGTTALAALGFAASAQAQLSQAQFGVGVELERVSDLYRGVGNELTILPKFSVESDDFELQTNEAWLKLHRDQWFDVSLKGQYRLDGYKSGDSNFLNGMSERRGALELGVAVTSEQWFGDVELAALTDISSRHRGYEISLTYGYPLTFYGARFRPMVSVAWQSENLVNYYWGVGASEARAGRPEYGPGASLNLAIGLQYQRELGRHHRFTGEFVVERPGADIDNSPLRDPDEAYRLSIGYLYLF